MAEFTNSSASSSSSAGNANAQSLSPITASSSTYLSYLENSRTVLSIPTLQRRYEWSETDALELLDHLWEASGIGSGTCNVNGHYYLGNIITCSVEAKDSLVPAAIRRQDRRDLSWGFRRLATKGADGRTVPMECKLILDGQQRLVTGSLIAAAMLHLMSAEPEIRSAGDKSRANIVEDKAAVGPKTRAALCTIKEELEMQNSLPIADIGIPRIMMRSDSERSQWHQFIVDLLELPGPTADQTLLNNSEMVQNRTQHGIYGRNFVAILEKLRQRFDVWRSPSKRAELQLAFHTFLVQRVHLTETISSNFALAYQMFEVANKPGTSITEAARLLFNFQRNRQPAASNADGDGEDDAVVIKWLAAEQELQNEHDGAVDNIVQKAVVAWRGRFSSYEKPYSVSESHAALAANGCAVHESLASIRDRFGDFIARSIQLGRHLLKKHKDLATGRPVSRALSKLVLLSDVCPGGFKNDLTIWWPYVMLLFRVYRKGNTDDFLKDGDGHPGVNDWTLAMALAELEVIILAHLLTCSTSTDFHKKMNERIQDMLACLWKEGEVIHREPDANDLTRMFCAADFSGRHDSQPDVAAARKRVMKSPLAATFDERSAIFAALSKPIFIGKDSLQQTAMRALLHTLNASLEGETDTHTISAFRTGWNVEHIFPQTPVVRLPPGPGAIDFATATQYGHDQLRYFLGSEIGAEYRDAQPLDLVERPGKDGIVYGVSRPSSVLHYLGNLTMLAVRDNSSIQNAHFVYKSVVFSKSRFIMNERLGELSDWTREHFLDRHHAMIKRFNEIYKLGHKPRSQPIPTPAPASKDTLERRAADPFAQSLLKAYDLEAAQVQAIGEGSADGDYSEDNEADEDNLSGAGASADGSADHLASFRATAAASVPSAVIGISDTIAVGPSALTAAPPPLLPSPDGSSMTAHYDRLGSFGAGAAGGVAAADDTAGGGAFGAGAAGNDAVAGGADAVRAAESSLQAHPSVRSASPNDRSQEAYERIIGRGGGCGSGAHQQSKGTHASQQWRKECKANRCAIKITACDECKCCKFLYCSSHRNRSEMLCCYCDPNWVCTASDREALTFYRASAHESYGGFDTPAVIGCWYAVDECCRLDGDSARRRQVQRRKAAAERQLRPVADAAAASAAVEAPSTAENQPTLATDISSSPVARAAGGTGIEVPSALPPASPAGTASGTDDANAPSLAVLPPGIALASDMEHDVGVGASGTPASAPSMAAQPGAAAAMDPVISAADALALERTESSGTSGAGSAVVNRSSESIMHIDGPDTSSSMQSPSLNGTAGMQPMSPNASSWGMNGDGSSGAANGAKPPARKRPRAPAPARAGTAVPDCGTPASVGSGLDTSGTGHTAHDQSNASAKKRSRNLCFAGKRFPPSSLFAGLALPSRCQVSANVKLGDCAECHCCGFRFCKRASSQAATSGEDGVQSSSAHVPHLVMVDEKWLCLHCSPINDTCFYDRDHSPGHECPYRRKVEHEAKPRPKRPKTENAGSDGSVGGAANSSMTSERSVEGFVPSSAMDASISAAALGGGSGAGAMAHTHFDAAAASHSNGAGMDAAAAAGAASSSTSSSIGAASSTSHLQPSSDFQLLGLGQGGGPALRACSPAASEASVEVQDADGQWQRFRPAT